MSTARAATRAMVTAAAVLAAVVPAGCTTSEQPPPDGPTTSPSSDAAAPTGGTTYDPSPEPIPEERLLAAFDLERSDEDLLATQRAFQEAVARCMRDKGFEYTPDVPGTISHPVDPVQDEEWYATWGYGISIDLTAAYPDAVEVPDPNAGYVASLTEAGRAAYRTALEGTPLEEGEDPDDPGQENGCYVESYDDVPASASATPPPLVTELRDQVSIAWMERTATDPRMVEARQTLVGCAADAGATGYDGKPPDGMAMIVGDRTFSPAYEAWSAHEQVAAAWEELTAGGEPDAGDLAAFQQWERDIAVAAYRCNAPVLALADEIGDEITREVVGPHRAELEDMLATWPDG